MPWTVSPRPTRRPRGRPSPVGEEITLNAGDTIYYDAAVLQSERNPGDEEVVLLLANLRGLDEPLRQTHETMTASAPAA